MSFILVCFLDVLLGKDYEQVYIYLIAGQCWI